MIWLSRLSRGLACVVALLTLLASPLASHASHRTDAVPRDTPRPSADRAKTRSDPARTTGAAAAPRAAPVSRVAAAPRKPHATLVRRGAEASLAPRRDPGAAARGLAQPPARAAVSARVARQAAPAPGPTRLALARQGEAVRVSVGHASGLRAVGDPLELRSSVALVADQRSGEVLFAKNPEAVLPIASITKLMTAMVVLDARAPLDEVLEISAEDIDTEKGSRSRLRPGVRLSRAELLQLALMASENRAAHALGRYHPEGLDAFVRAMNAKARQLGMNASHFNDPTGLSGRNVSSAYDLTRMLRAAYDYPLIRQYSIATELAVDAGSRPLMFRNTNRLIDRPNWSIGLQKTGYIAEAGRCLVMQVQIHDRPLLMVLLDSDGRHTRYGDAQRIRDWLEAETVRAPTLQSGREPAVRPVSLRYASAGS